MNRTIRTVAAIAVVSLAFQVRLTAAPKSVKPAKATPTPPAARSVKPVKSVKTAAPARMKSAKPTTKADVKAAKHSSTTATAPRVVSNPVADKISRNPNLAATIASRLPSDMTLAQASTGFRNQGQFIAAVNVSKNLGIDFVKLQTAMTGQTVSVDPKTHAITTKPTGDTPLSLGRSIQTLRPGTDADAALQKAQAQTSQMVQ